MMRSGHGELRKSIVQDSSRACAFPGFSERLSPLLLCSEKAFARLFDNKREADRDIEPAFLRSVVRQDFTPEEAFLPDQAFAMTLL